MTTTSAGRPPRNLNQSASTWLKIWPLPKLAATMEICLRAVGASNLGGAGGCTAIGCDGNEVCVGANCTGVSVDVVISPSPLYPSLNRRFDRRRSWNCHG